MNKKNKKQKTCQNCVDCENQTNDYYPVFSNRGTIYRCVDCYELWLTRSTRYNVINNGKVSSSLNDHVDKIDPLGRNEWTK